MTKSFDEWWEDNYMNLSADRTEAGDIYNLGAESRQAEVDELKMSNHHLSVQVIDSGDFYNHEKRHGDALQKRIDRAVKYVSESPLKDVSRRAMINFMDILKGEENDTN